MKSLLLYVFLASTFAVIAFVVGYKIRPKSDSSRWGNPPETERFEQLNRLFDTQLKERFAEVRHAGRLERSDLVSDLMAQLRPLDVSIRIFGEEELAPLDGGITVFDIKMTLSLDPDSNVDLNAQLLLPPNLPAPSILVLHGMGSRIEALVKDIDYHHGVGLALARAGFAVLMPERLETDYEGRAVLTLKSMALGTTVDGLDLRQLQSWFEYLEDHESTVGYPWIHGTSNGGYHGLLLAALEPKVGGVYVSGTIADWFGVLFKRFPHPGNPAGEKYMRTFWQGDLGLYSWNMGSLLDQLNLISAVSPRPLAIETGKSDKIKMAGLNDVLEEARTIYRNLDAEQNLKIYFHEGHHEVDVQATVDWFQKSHSAEKFDAG